MTNTAHPFSVTSDTALTAAISSNGGHAGGGFSHSEARTLATLHNTPQQNSEQVAAVAMSGGLQTWLWGLPLLLLLLVLGFYLYTMTERFKTRVP